MILETKEIKKTFKRTWPKLRDQWMDQERYWVPALEELKGVIETVHVNEMTYMPEIMECESFALILWASVKKELIERAQNSTPAPESLKHTWTFGFARLLNPSHLLLGGAHAMNVCLTTEGEYLIEPQTNRIIKPERSKRIKDGDFVYFIMM